MNDELWLEMDVIINIIIRKKYFSNNHGWIPFHPLNQPLLNWSVWLWDFLYIWVETYRKIKEKNRKLQLEKWDSTFSFKIINKYTTMVMQPKYLKLSLVLKTTLLFYLKL